MSSVVNVTCQPALTAPRPGRDQCESLVPSPLVGHGLPLPQRHHGHQSHQGALEMSHLCPCCQQEHQSEDASRNKILKSRLAYQPSCQISDLYLEQKGSVPWWLKSLSASGAVVQCKGSSGGGTFGPQAVQAHSALWRLQLGSALHVLLKSES